MREFDEKKIIENIKQREILVKEFTEILLKDNELQKMVKVLCSDDKYSIKLPKNFFTIVHNDELFKKTFVQELENYWLPKGFSSVNIEKKLCL